MKTAAGEEFHQRKPKARSGRLRACQHGQLVGLGDVRQQQALGPRLIAGDGAPSTNAAIGDGHRDARSPVPSSPSVMFTALLMPATMSVADTDEDRHAQEDQVGVERLAAGFVGALKGQVEHVTNVARLGRSPTASGPVGLGEPPVAGVPPSAAIAASPFAPAGGGSVTVPW
jgi:hypothetical protein